MKKPLLSTLLILPVVAVAQFSIGSRAITFNDPDRGGRAIPCEVYYPALSAGSSADVAEGAFPVLAFGHGFAMGVGSYGNITTAFVPEGYIVVLPTTEGSLLPAPSHPNFGLDLAFIVGAMQAEGASASSPFFAHVASTSAVMGHSMGGGAAFLAALSEAPITTLVTYAPAETNPSAIAAAAQVDIPALVFAGSQDCVTPPETNQIPMYEALAGACKAYVEITGGGHCNFANSNFNCSFGELTCGGGGSLGRPGQQTVANSYTLLWLARYLKDDVQAGTEFELLLTESEGVVVRSVLDDCPLVVPTNVTIPGAEIGAQVVPLPMGYRAELRLAQDRSLGARFLIIDASGRVVREERITDLVHPIPRGELVAGSYTWVVLNNDGGRITGRLPLD